MARKTNYIAIVVIVVIATAGVYIATQPAAPPASTPTSLTVSEAVGKATSDSVRLEMEELASGKGLVIDRDDPEFGEILHYLNDASTMRVVAKTTVVNNQTVSVTVPYPYGVFLTFKLNDGSEVRFDSTSSELWYESDEAVYEASVDPGLYDMLNQLLQFKGPQAGTNMLTQMIRSCFINRAIKIAMC